MVDESSTRRSEPLADLITLAAGPIAAVIRSFDQLRRGSEELIRAVENFNTTMTTLNETAARVNRLLGDVEEPVRAMIPQITRTVRHGRRDVEEAGRADRSGGARAQPARRHARTPPIITHVAAPTSARSSTRSTTSCRRLVAARPDRRVGRRAVRAAHPRDDPPGHVAGRRDRRPSWSLAPPPPATRAADAPPRGRQPRRRRRRRRPAQEGAGQEGGGEEGAGARSRRPSAPDALAPLRSAAAHERRRHDVPGQRGAAHVDRRPAFPPRRRRHEAEGDAVAEHRARSSRSSPRRPVSPSTSDRALGARRAATLGGDADEVAVHAPLALGGQRGATAEGLLAPRHDPARARPAAA